MLLIILFFCTLFFLGGSFFLTAMMNALSTLSKKEAKREINATHTFFYRSLHALFFPTNEYEGLFFVTLFAQNVSRFFFAACSLLFLSQTEIYHNFQKGDQGLEWFWLILAVSSFILLSFLIGDYLPRLFGIRLSRAALRLSAPFASLFLILVFPVTYFFLKISEFISSSIYIGHLHHPSTGAKQEILEIIEEARFGPTIDAHDKKLIEAVLSFRERIVREIMVPRVDLFGLASTTSIKDAAKILHDEGYSRTPVYQDSIDNIVGVLMYKDLLAKYMEYEKQGNDHAILNAPIESIQKKVLYTPETKKLSSLLQEFRKKQVHLAIVVDEYGGTEGLITIEDILEEIVGDISDEYDEDEELYRALPDGSFVVDAKMSILDIEEQLGIHIPQDADYDTLNGYIYQSLGTIPQKGFIIHHDDFELEVLRSNEKSVEEVRIKKLSQ